MLGWVDALLFFVLHSRQMSRSAPLGMSYPEGKGKLLATLFSPELERTVNKKTF